MFQYDVPNWIMQQKYKIKHSKFDFAESNARTKRYKRCYDTQNAELNIANILKCSNEMKTLIFF